MSRSFYTVSSDTELLARSGSFSALISSSPTTYNLTAPKAAAYAAVHSTFASAMAAIAEPGTKTGALVADKNDARQAVRDMAAELTKFIDTADLTDGQRIALGLSVRGTPEPTPAPGLATDFKMSVNGDGSVDVKFKCVNPVGTQGTIYQVWRCIGDPSGEYTYLCAAGHKKFTDDSIPAGASQITYRVQAIRSTLAGPWATYYVTFGKSASGGMTIASTSEKAMKVAA